MDLQILSTLKQQYESLFALTIFVEEDDQGHNEQDFIFKPIGREEYRMVLEEFEKHKDLSNFQEDICQFAIVYPMDYQFHLGVGGVAEVLSDAILDTSGLFEQQGLELLMENRAQMNNFDFQIECIIHEAFPEHSLGEIGTWDMRKTMYFYARAEWILVTLRGVRLELMSAGEEQPVQQEQPTQQYDVVKDMSNDFEEARMVPKGEYETNPQELLKMKASEMNEHQKRIAEEYTYRMINNEASSKGAKVGKIEKTIGNMPMPELDFYRNDFELGR